MRVMAQARLELFADAGLIGIQLPGVEIDHDRMRMLLLGLSEHTKHIKDPEHAQIAPPPTGKVQARNANRCRREFPKFQTASGYVNIGESFSIRSEERRVGKECRSR